jgi:hypothetical protein
VEAARVEAARVEPTPDITTDSLNNLASLRDLVNSWTRDAREKVYDCCRDCMTVRSSMHQGAERPHRGEIY